MFLASLHIFIPLSELLSSNQIDFSGSFLSAFLDTIFFRLFQSVPAFSFSATIPDPLWGCPPRCLLRVPSRLSSSSLLSLGSLEIVLFKPLELASSDTLCALFLSNFFRRIFFKTSRLLRFLSFMCQFFKCRACCSFFSLHPGVLGCSGRTLHRRPCAFKQRWGLNTDCPCGLRTLKRPSFSWGLLSLVPSWDKGVRITKCPSHGGFESSHQSPLCPWDTGCIWTSVQEEELPNWPRPWTHSSEVSSAPFSTCGPSSESTQQSIFDDVGSVTAQSQLARDSPAAFIERPLPGELAPLLSLVLPFSIQALT